MSSEAFVLSTSVSILSADCMFLLSQFVIGPIAVHLMKWLLNARIYITRHYIQSFAIETLEIKSSWNSNQAC